MSVGFTPTSKYTQEARRLQVFTGLGDDELLLRRLNGVEGISRLFRFELDLLSHNGNIDPTKIVGENVGIALSSDDENVRLFNGHVRAFQYVGLEGRGMYQYRAEVVPWLWFLDKTSDCRVYQNMTVQEIVEEIFADLGFSDYQFSLTETHDPLEYCVQYCESDLNFVHRLLESEGMFYYFEHLSKQHKLHICDSTSAYPKLSEDKLIHSSGNRMDHYIHSWQHHFQYCSGAYSQSDFDFEKFNQSLVTESASKVKLPNNSIFDQYDYPGNYKDNDKGRALTTLRMQQEEMTYERVSGNSNVHFVEVGKTFSLESDENEMDNGKSFVVTEIHHNAINTSLMEEGEYGEVYANQFSCIPADIAYRPPQITPKPRMDSIQTALVVGPGGEEIHTDKYGRIKIQFHWDRYGKKDESSSCWVRVASQQAGKKWGVVGIPRIGNEVVVSFENGDPDKPLVIGCVYNNENMPPLDLPAAKNQTGMKSKTFKNGGGQNEISVDDTKDNEAMKIHASYNSNTTVANDMSTIVDNDNSHHVKNNSTEKVDVDHSVTVGGNQTQSVKGNQSNLVDGNQDDTVNGNAEKTVGGSVETSIGSTEDHSVGSNQTQDIGANQTIQVGANQELSVGANQTVEVTGQQQISALSQDVSITTNATMSALDVSVTGSVQINLTVAGSSVSITPAGITISMGASSINVGPTGVTIAGPIVKLN